VAAAKKDNLGDTTKYLAYALHAAEDRGSHGEGNPGMGHDPRTKVPPEEAPGGVNEWYIDKGWDPDDLAKNANGKEFATQLAAQVLNDFYSRCNQKARDLIAFEFGSSFNLQEQLEKGRAKFKGGRGRTKGFPLGKGF
jgi:hypothetical protein